MGKILGITHISAKFLSICVLVKLERQLSAPKCNGSPHYRREKMKGGKMSSNPSHHKIHWANSKRSQGPRIILCGSGLHPQGPWLHSWSHPSSFLKGKCTCSEVVLSTCFLPVEFWVSDSLLLFSPLSLSLSFTSSWQCFCWMTFSKTTWVSYVCL